MNLRMRTAGAALSAIVLSVGCGTYPCTLYEEQTGIAGTAIFRSGAHETAAFEPAESLMFDRAFSPCGPSDDPQCQTTSGTCPANATTCLRLATRDFSLNFLPPGGVGTFSLDSLAATLCVQNASDTGPLARCSPASGSLVVRSVNLSCSTEPTSNCRWFDGTFLFDANPEETGASLAGRVSVADEDVVTDANATCGGASGGDHPLGLN